MIAAAVVEEVRQLLAEGKLSQRKIARRTGISRGTVAAIAAGRRPDYEAMRRARHEESPEAEGPLGRCRGCGGMVYLPCRLCNARAMAAERPRVPEWLRPLEEPLGLDLREEHRARYEVIHAEKVRAAAALETGDASRPDAASSSEGLPEDGAGWCDGVGTEDDGPAMDPRALGDAFDWEDDESEFECAGAGVAAGEDGV